MILPTYLGKYSLRLLIKTIAIFEKHKQNMLPAILQEKRSKNDKQKY